MKPCPSRPSTGQTYGDRDSHTCVSVCPDTYLADDTTSTCVTSCPTGYVEDLTNKKCVKNCPSTEPFIKGSVCVADCGTQFGNSRTM